MLLLETVLKHATVLQQNGSWLFVLGVTFPTPKGAAMAKKESDFFGEWFIKLKGTEGLKGDICHIAK